MNWRLIPIRTYSAMELVIYEIVCHRPFHAPFRFVEFKGDTATKCKRTTIPCSTTLRAKKGIFIAINLEIYKGTQFENMSKKPS